MVLPLGLDSPAVDTTFNSAGIHDLSMAQSFITPANHKNGLVTDRNARNRDLRTPRGRAPLVARNNVPAITPREEFTPMLRTAKKPEGSRTGRRDVPASISRTAKLVTMPQRGSAKSPAMPVGSPSSTMDTSAYVSKIIDETQLPSSAPSTPYIKLPRRDGNGLLQDGANMMTLRDQENMINKVEKENFGLKLKIHFLEEALKKAGPGFSEMALKENTELKVDKMTMQRELQRFRKTLATAERELETYRQRLQESQDRVKRRHESEEQDEQLDRMTRYLESQQEELNRLQETETAQEEEVRQLREASALHQREIDRLKSQLEDRDDQIQEMNEKLTTVEAEEANVNDKIADLEAELREKERIIDTQTEDAETAISELRDEIEDLKEKLESAPAPPTPGRDRAVAALKNEISDLEAELREKERENLEQAEDHRAALEDLQAQLEKANEEIECKDEMLNDAKERHEGNDIMKDMLEAEEKRKSKYQARCAELETELAETKAELDEMSASMDAKDRELKSMAIDHRSDLEELRKEVAQWQRRAAESGESSDGELRELRDKTRELQAEIEEKERLVTSLNHGRDDDARKFRREIDSLQDDHDKDLRKLKHEIDYLKKQLDAAGGDNTQVEAVRDELRHLKSELVEKEHALSIQEEALQAIKVSMMDEQNRLKEKLSRSERAKDTVEVRLRDQIQELKDTMGTPEGQKMELGRLHDEIEDLQAEIREKETALADQADAQQVLKETMMAEQERLKEKLHRVEKSKDAVESRLRGQIQELKESVATTGAQHKDADRLREEIEQLKADYDERKDELEIMENRVLLERQAVRAVETELAQDRETLQAARDELQAVRVRKERTKTAVLEAQEKEKSLRTELAGLEQRREQISASPQRHGRHEAEIKSLREESRRANQRAEALLNELEALQIRHDQSVDRFGRLQEKYKGAISHVEKKVDDKDGNHVREIKGLTKQILYLRRKCEREANFRADLAFSKDFCMMQIEQYEAYNKLDLELLGKLKSPRSRGHTRKIAPKRTLRGLAFMVIAGLRIKRKQEEWAESRKIKEGLVRTLENTRRKSRKSVW